MIQQSGLIHRAGVVVQATGNGQVNGKILLRHTEGGQVGGDGFQLHQTQVKQLVSPGVALQRGNHLGVGAPDGDEGKDFCCLFFGQTAVLHENDLHLVSADFVQLVHGTHDVAGLLAQTQHIIEAAENLAVVHPNLEPGQAKAPEDLVDNGGNFRLVENVQLAVADDVDVRLVKFAEAAPLCPLTPVDLADLVAAEGESQLVIVQGNVFCQRHRQVEPQRQVTVTLLKAVNLLFGFAAALGKQNLGILDGGGVQGGKTIGGIGAAENIHHGFKTNLLVGQQLHEAGQSPGLNNFHRYFLSKVKNPPAGKGGRNM